MGERTGLASRAGLGRAIRPAAAVPVAATCPLVPAPGSSPDQGFVGALYADAFGFFEVADGSLPLAAAGAGLALLAMPLLLLRSYRAPMAEWRAPVCCGPAPSSP